MPTELDFAERRVLGVLIEKGFTTPDQYPLTLNGVVVGSNQKSCRDPVSSLEEQAVYDTLDSLRQKGFVILVRMEGSRADRWKHRTGENLELEPKEVALLGELLLRGPQTDGELRQRANRMVPMGSLDEVMRLIAGLSSREDPLIRRLAPLERKRGVRYGHTLYPAAESPDDVSEVPANASSGWGPASGEAASVTRPGFLTGQGASTPLAAVSPLEPERASEPVGSTAFTTEAAGVPQATGTVSGDVISELQRKIRTLEERVEELEATFVKFLR